MIYYRVSDNSYQKPRLPGSTKQSCFLDFIGKFGDQSLEIIADNCRSETVGFFVDRGCRVHEITTGNAGSFRSAMDLASVLPADEIVYMIEDDYLHRRDASMILIGEGLGLAAYATLYDHPDKYTPQYDLGEFSKVCRTEGSHWRFTRSTCMTFAARAGTLQEDRGTWERHISGDHPNDDAAFVALAERGRRLAVCIPGRANHCDLAIPQEPWAIQAMIDAHRTSESFDPILRMGKCPLDTLKMLSVA